MTQEAYCGFLCSEILERQQEIANEVKDFSKYNPEFAKVMLRKLMDVLHDANGSIDKT